MPKKGRGRPKGTGLFQNGLVKRALVSVIRKCGGITNAHRHLLTQGITINGKRKRNFTISFPTLVKIANDAKLKFHRGRPKLEAV